jgi:hypothetical protein
MNSHQQQVLATFRRALVWRTERPDVSGIPAGTITSPALTGTPAGSTTPAPSTPALTGTPATPIAEQFSLLDSAVNDATAAASDQEGLNRSVLGLGAEIKTLRTELVSHQMVHVATIARTAIPDVARMTEALRTPKVTRKTETLLSAAEAMATAGEKYQPQLVAAGLPADFPAELRTVASSLKSAIDTRGASVATRRGTAKAFVEALARGRKAVDTLTVLIKRQFKGDKATVAEWMQLRRVPIVAVKQPAGTTVPAPVPASVPVAVPVPTAPATAPVHVLAATAAAAAPEQGKVAA